MSHIVAQTVLKKSIKPRATASFDARRLYTLRNLHARLVAAGDTYARCVEPDVRRIAACLIAGVPAES